MKRLTMIIIALSLSATAGGGFAGGDPVAGQTKSAICSACHGTDGNSNNSMYPSLAGQVPGYITQQLSNFKSGIRSNAIMAGITQLLTDEDMANLDAWYSSQQPTVYAITDDQLETAQLGQKLYRGGYPAMEIPACMGCHGPTGSGIPPMFPRLAGQITEYTETQLLAFKSEQRRSEIMSPIALRLSAKQIQALALYLSALQ
jgi:cytochrome c553